MEEFSDEESSSPRAEDRPVPVVNQERSRNMLYMVPVFTNIIPFPYAMSFQFPVMPSVLPDTL
jgi:hypothetical protein